MKQLLPVKIVCLLVSIFFFSIQQLHAQFGKNTLVVLRINSDTAKTTPTSAAYPVFLDEISKTGSFIHTYAIPTTGSTKLTMTGSSTTEGQMTLSQDSTQLVIAGYAAAPGTPSVSKTYSKNVNRVVDVIKKNGTIVRACSSDTFFSANTIRSAATDKGKNFWGSGSNTGTPYIGKDTPAILQKFTTNTRVVNVYKGQLYFSTASTSGDSGIGVYRVGTGVPKTAGQNFTPIVLTGATSQPGAFVFNSTATLLYVANEDSASGAIQKWRKASGKWKLVKTFSVGNKLGARGLCVDFTNKTYPTLYATTTGETVVKIFDSVAKPPITVLYTAPAHTAIRGIQFSPIAKTKPAGFTDDENAPEIAKSNNLNLFPNPVRNTIYLTFSSQKAQKYNLVISNVAGRVIFSQQGLLQNGTNRVSANVAALNKGIYVAEIITTEGKNSIQFEKE